jgi:inner membrane protein
MRAGTHILAGVFVGYAVGAGAALSPVELYALGAVGGLCAMIPDIDHPQSAIRRKTGLLGHLAAFWMNHRGITHTLLAVLLMLLISSLLVSPLVALVMTAAYASHLLLDACTPSGVPVFGPVSWRRVHALPRGLRVRTGSFAEKGVLLGMLVLLYVGNFVGKV